jgi:hypothetical protein
MIDMKAHVDTAGGSGKDSYAMAGAYKVPEGNKLVLAFLREVKPPFSPAEVTAEFARLMRSYRVFECTGDRYAGSWPQEQFAEHGITLMPSPRTTSELFLEFLPLLNSGRVELLDDKAVINQLCALERKAGRGRDYVAAGPGSHDDVACVVAGAIVRAGKAEEAFVPIPIFIADEKSHPTYDRWSARWWGEGGPAPFESALGYERDTYVGTSAWVREQLARRNQ